MFEKSDLEELHALLRKANVTDDHLARGVRLTAQGEQKIAKRFGIEVDAVPEMLLALSKHVSAISEDAPRYTFERDYLGNITLRDSKTDKSIFVQGDKAFALEDELVANPGKEQEIIAREFGQTVLNEADSENAIVSDKGTFNFPYKGMFATAVYGLDSKGQFQCRVVSLRNSEDEEMDLTDELTSELNRVAMTWVDKV